MQFITIVKDGQRTPILGGVNKNTTMVHIISYMNYMIIYNLNNDSCRLGTSILIDFLSPDDQQKHVLKIKYLAQVSVDVSTLIVGCDTIT